MRAEIICVGTELLLGDILNTNAQYLSQTLAELGINVYSQSVVGDNSARLNEQLTQALSRSEIVILSGGLGPTEDDITKEVTAKVLGLPLELHTASLEHISEYFAKTGRVMSQSNKKQALTIKGATVLENENGTAPGYIVKNNKNTVILLPGPPSELVPMFENKVVPVLTAMSGEVIVSHNIRVFGIGESLVAEQCGELTALENPTVATYAKPGEVDIRVTAKARNEQKANEMCKPVIELIEKQFGSNIYGHNCESLQQRVVELLSEKNKKLATAESCTAGMLSSRITEIPGASEVFEMGVTAYANYIKIEALGVDKNIIETKGAVCPEVAAQMALGIREMCGSNIGVGITGVAGPGQSEGKPAGLVYIAITDGDKVFSRKIMCGVNNREKTRIIASSTALDMVRRYLEGCDELLSRGTLPCEALDVIEGYTLPGTTPIVFSKKRNTPRASLNQLAFTDEEMKGLFAIGDDVNIPNPEKLKLAEENAANFVFEDDYLEAFEQKAEKLEIEDENGNIEMITGLEEENIENDNEQAASVKTNVYKKTKTRKALKINKNGKFYRFISAIFPLKGDSVKEIIRKTIFLVAFVVLIGTTVYLVNYFAESVSKTNEYNKVASEFETYKTEEKIKNGEGILLDFENLINQNRDIKGWLKINNTKVNYPVYQCNDNDFYINHDMNKKTSRYGALFIDAENRIGVLENSKNLIIYGHSMRDGAMFGELKKYLNYDFYKENPTFEFTSLYREGKYKVFSVFVTNTLPEHDNGEVFNYRQSNFANEEEFKVFIEELRKRSVINTDVDVTYDDEIITLSTCAYDFDEARLVVVARRVRDDSYDKYKAVSSSVNTSPLYPEIWYQKKGTTKPSFSSQGSSSNLTEESSSKIDANIEENSTATEVGNEVSSEQTDDLFSQSSSDASLAENDEDYNTSSTSGLIQ